MNREKTLGESRTRTLAAAAQRILPSDDTPGAAETGVAEYIERALVEELPTAERTLLERGLDLLESSARDRLERSFCECSADQQDDLLRSLESLEEPWPRVFLRRLIHLALEGFLCDPRRGGNRDGLGWGFIGVRPETPAAVPTSDAVFDGPSNPKPAS